MVRKSVIILNQTKSLVFPSVRRSKVMPKEILEKVDAKQEIDAPMLVPRAIKARCSGLMSMVRFPKPSIWPYCVSMASTRRRILRQLVSDAVQEHNDDHGEDVPMMRLVCDHPTIAFVFATAWRTISIPRIYRKG